MGTIAFDSRGLLTKPGPCKCNSKATFFFLPSAENTGRLTNKTPCSKKNISALPSKKVADVVALLSSSAVTTFVPCFTSFMPLV